MKNNVIKYIFLLFVVALIIFAFYRVYYEDKKSNDGTEDTTTNVEENISKDIRLCIVEYDTMNPVLSNNRNVQEISRLLFEPLITLDKNYKPEGAIAEEWSKVGDTSYVIRLKQNIKWQDGTKVTANDVKFTIDRLRDTQSIYSYNAVHIIETEVVDSYTIKLNLDSNIPCFEYNLIFPILSKKFYENEDFSNTEKNAMPMASGMYKIVSNDGNTIVLEKNENYWNKNDKDSKIETIMINLYSSMGEAYNNFKLGNVDLLTTQNNNVEEYIGTMGYNKKEYTGREHDFLAMNCNHYLLSRSEVRKAIAYAIDKSSIVSSVFNGEYYIADFPLDCGFWCYNKENSSIGYNPDQARQILIDNGWQYKNRYWQKVEDYRTIRLTIDLVVNSENYSQVQVAENIKSSLESIGIRVNLNKVSYESYNSYLENKSYAMILTGTTIGLTPDLSSYLGEDNLANYYNEETTNIINELKNVTTEEKIKENIKRLAEIYTTEFPYLSLYFNKNTVIYNSSITGDVEPNCYSIFYGIENWYRTY